MDKRIPPLVTPFAVLSIALAIGTTNVVVNQVSGTNEGKPRTTQTVTQRNVSNQLLGKPDRPAKVEADKTKATTADNTESKADESTKNQPAVTESNKQQPETEIKKPVTTKTPTTNKTITKKPDANNNEEKSVTKVPAVNQESKPTTKNPGATTTDKAEVDE